MAGMATLRSTLRTHPLATLSLTVVFIIAATQWLRDTGDRVDDMLHGEQYVSSPFELDAFTFKVTELEPSADAAGLRKGDQVLNVNGRTLDGLTDYFGAVRRARVGDRLHVRVRRFTPAGQTEQDLTVPLRQFTYVGFTKGASPAYWYLLVFRMATPFLCMLLGFWVAAVRVYDRAAWYLLFVMLSVANLITDGRTILGNEDSLQPFLTAFSVGLIRLGPIALAYFGITFPEPLAFDRNHPWVKWILLGPVLARAVFQAFMLGVILHHQTLAVQFQPVFHFIQAPGDALELTAIAVFFLSLFYKTFTAVKPDSRRRLLLLDTAAVAGLLPLLVGIIVCSVRGIPFQGWYAAVSIGMLFIFPVTMAYVIVVHRALDVRVVVRQGVQYLLATGGIGALQVAISVGIIVAAANIGANTSVPQRVALISVGFLLLAGLRGFAQRLRAWIDRRFFREAYEADAILGDLAAKVRTMVQTGPLLETVANRVASALHVPRIAILLDGDGAFRPAYALGYGTTPDACLSDRSLTVRRLSKAQHALVEFDDADSWVQLADDEERAALEKLRPELLLPLSLNDKVLGIMSLGPKRSEEPFSKADIRLLDLVAAQTGLALENGRLTEAIGAEAAAREKRHRELELAREVQERLFPQEFPRLPGLDYAGACRPALGVGGDYYDFIRISDCGLAIAIGDVSGKGISAALLMATLRAFLRGQTIDRQTDLTAVIANLNRLVYESSAHNRYATFFFAVLDLSSRVLTYVNAGHNSPILFRAADAGDALRLDDGGSVVGLLPNGSWVQGQVMLEPGDLLVAFTDGVSEAMNASDEEWGEEGLMGAVQANRSAPAPVILEGIMTSADEFVAGFPQYDDMTLIVMRAF
jgi:sigma-B regulation protein RsbU (phosphoserine phosphatase)